MPEAINFIHDWALSGITYGKFTVSKIVMLINEVFSKCLLHEFVNAYLRVCKRSYVYLREYLPVILCRSQVIKLSL